MRARRGGGGGQRGRVARRAGAWLALAALLVQLVATIGHFHREDFAFYDAGGASVALSGQSLALQPRGPEPTPPAHDDCSLCFSLQLAGSSTMPMVVALPAPIALDRVAHETLHELRLVAVPHLLFQTRAPPIA